jgi:hypothetical protein
MSSQTEPRRRSMNEKEEKPRYPVGFKKPPCHSQFKPGQSGNPKGRPKKKEDKSPSAAVWKECEVLVIVEEDGKHFKATKVQAAAKRLWAMAMNGDIKAITLVLKVCEQHASKAGGGVNPFIEALLVSHAQAEAPSEHLTKKSGKGDDDEN